MRPPRLIQSNLELLIAPLRLSIRGIIRYRVRHGGYRMMTRYNSIGPRVRAAASMPTPRLTRPNCIEDMLDYQLYLLYRDCGYVIERLCQVEFGVTRRRWRILAILSAAEGITVSDLSKRAELDIAQTSRTVGTLAREGYLKRLANPNNARFSQIILTENGRNLYRSMFTRFRQANKLLLRDMSEDQVQHLCAAIAILRDTATQLIASGALGKPANFK